MNIHSSWQPLFNKYNFNIECLYLNYIYQTTFPPKDNVFRVFEIDLYEINIVLLGQDPYHKINQATGLSFSVPIDVNIPPSLKNIFKELKRCFPDRNYKFTSGNLDKWFNREKILLLNSSLTVIEGKPGSHMKIWEEFTDDVINFISIHNTKCVFLLLGNFAIKKSKFINNKLNIVTCCHPSPLARGFIGSNVFIEVEKKLNKVIDWSN
jgi:uracil-DNA glycosylase